MFSSQHATTDKRPTQKSINAKLPDGGYMHSTHDDNMHIPALPAAATKTSIFPVLDTSLISIGQFCDAGCSALFDSLRATIFYKNRPIITGTRIPPGLWYTTIPTKTNGLTDPLKEKIIVNPTMIQQAGQQSANAANATTTTAEHIQFLHAAAFSPATSTWIDAIRNGHFITWPGLTVEAVKKHLPKSFATAQGHLDQTRMNQRSTKTTKQQQEDDSEPIIPIQEPDNNKTQYVYAATAEFSDTNMVYSDLTGRFPHTSNQGNKYVLILYTYDGNAIIQEPMRSRTDSETIRAYKVLLERLNKVGLSPKLQRLDNEASQALREFLDEQNIDWQLVPPHCHRRNAAERAIRTFKNHFVAGLCSTDPNFDIRLWDRLLDQAERTLNLLRRSRTNPKLSAYAQLHGQFDFNATPLAPPGIRVLAHEKPSNRASWAPHGADGWYIGPAMKHYRCFRVYINKTQAERITDTVEFFPNNYNMPKFSSTDAIIKASRDMVKALREPHPATPFNNFGDKQFAALESLAEIFDTALPRVEHNPTSTEVKAPPKQHKMQTRAQTQHQSNHIDGQEPQELNWEWQPQANAVLDPDTGNYLEYNQLIKHDKMQTDWWTASANEFGRLMQGVGGRLPGTDTLFFIHRKEVPKDRRATYARFVCQIRPQKAETNRVRMTVGGNLIDYPGDKSTRTADITTVKLLVNSTISTPKAELMCMDLKNFYLGTPLDRSEYMKVHISKIPAEIIKEYKLVERDLIDDDGYVWMRIDKGMYGLPQAGILANKLLAKRLAKHGYYQVRHTNGLWKHTTRPIQFTLIVDDFAVMYTAKEHAHHLAAALKEDYEVTMDWTGSLYAGITLTWDYVHKTVDLSMPGYVQTMLDKFNHPKPTIPEHSPYQHNRPQYGVKVQLTDPIDNSPPLSAAEKTRIQSVIGTNWYYARAVDPTIITALSALASQQATPTENTAKRVVKYLNYMATNPNAMIRYHQSDMILKNHTDSSYLNEPKGRSRQGTHFYLGNDTINKPEIFNGPVLNTSDVEKNVMASAAEAEICGAFKSMQNGLPLRIALEELGHPQPATPIQLDNSMAASFANKDIKQRRSRAIDMRFYWIQDRVEQGQYHIYWAPANLNLADYFTKHHAAQHHRNMRKHYLNTDQEQVEKEIHFITTINTH